MQLTIFSELKIVHSPGKNLLVADMLSRSFTKAELQINQLKHKQLPPQIDIAILQHKTLKPVNYLIKQEKVLPHQEHDSHPRLADYDTDQFSIRINDKGNDIVVKPLTSFSLKAITTFRSKFKTPIKKHNKTFHSMILILQEMMKSKYILEFLNPIQLFLMTIQYIKETFSTINKPKPITIPESPFNTRIHLCNRYTKKTLSLYTLFTNHTLLPYILFQMQKLFRRLLSSR